VERQLAKKCPNPSRLFISKKIVVKDSFKKSDMQQKEFDEHLSLLIVKNNLLIQIFWECLVQTISITFVSMN
jgi:hypothetical protein